MKKEDLSARLGRLPGHLELGGLPGGARLQRGKVRDVVDLGQELLITTTDRISAFDSVLTTVPCKGEVLNTLSLFWFAATRGHHPAPRAGGGVSRAPCAPRSADVLPFEVVVRGYLTGSAWRDYQAGEDVSGIRLPAGMRFNQKFEVPLITPSTKEGTGTHDRPVSREEILASGKVDTKVWEKVEEDRAGPLPTRNGDRRSQGPHPGGHEVRVRAPGKHAHARG